MITRIGSVTLEVPDLETSTTFFTTKVGLDVTQVDGDTVYLTSTARHHEMILVRSPVGRTALRHLNLETSIDDFDAAVTQAVGAGAVDRGPISHPGVERAHLLEVPHGFVVKLYAGMGSVDAPSGGDLPRPYQFSHFNIGVPEVAPILAFFAEAFSLRVSDWLRSKEAPLLGWMHCPVDGAPHHGVAILESEVVKLHHIAFDFEQVSDVVARVDDYVDRDHYLVWGMGRHGTGGSVFAYVEDPSGMMVELGSGMITIGDDPRWIEPRVWPMDDPRGVDEWGSSIPDAWLAKAVGLSDVSDASAV